MKQKTQDELLKRFKKLLSSYAEFEEIPIDSLGMNHVRGALLHLLMDKDMDGKGYTDHMMVALAGVVGHLATTEIAGSFASFSEEAVKDSMMRNRIKSISKASEWVEVVTNKFDIFSLFRKKKALSPMTYEEVETILPNLLEKYFPKETAAIA